MAKEWNRRQKEQLQSYHIEVIALKMDAQNEDFSEPGWSLVKFFETAQDYMWSCEHLGHDVADYLGYSETETILEQLRAAEVDAVDAWALTYADGDDDAGAIKGWRALLGQKFPTYGS